MSKLSDILRDLLRVIMSPVYNDVISFLCFFPFGCTTWPWFSGESIL